MLLNRLIKGLLGSTYSIVGTKDNKVWLEFQTIDECSMTGNAVVTKYPTEKGIHMTDYKYMNPDTVSIVGIVQRNGMNPKIPEINSLNPIMGTWDRATAVERIRENLKTLTRNMILLTVKTRNGGLWKNMTMTDYTIDETADNFGLFQVTMQLQEVPQFNQQGELMRNVADTSTKSTGITETRAVG